MADEAAEAAWLSVGKAARALGVSKSAIRKLVASGALVARAEGDSTAVLLPSARPNESAAASAAPSESASDRSPDDAATPGPEGTEAGADIETPPDADRAVQIATLTERAAHLAARLAAAEAERDRWVAAAAEARDDARAAVAARDDAERELRLLLARAQFVPALPAAADPAAVPGPVGRRSRRFWQRR